MPRRALVAALAPALLALFVSAAAAVTLDGSPLAHTYSIVARDAVTGEFGVAVQSHYFSVGPTVPWAESGVGAVATQSLVLVDYGPLGLKLMREGLSARQALDSLLGADPGRDGRQVAMVDAKGNVAAWTGPKCIADAGDAQGDGFSVQANLMASPTVWPAMKRAFEAAQGDLAARMLAALDAAEAEGGDIRGRQSCAILVVKGAASAKPWNDVVVDLRVEDHPAPLVEMRRLLRLQRAYRVEDQGDTFTSEGRTAEAAAAYAEAMKLAPDVVELQFWSACTMWQNGQKPRAKEVFRSVFARESRWVPLPRRLAKAGLFPNVEAEIAEVEALAPRRPKARATR